jgi:uncharacterized small protein (DUF1192 family)
MEWDELQPRPVKAVTIGEDLRSLSVSELEARIIALKAEIQRVEMELAAKKAHETAAAAFFKS